MMALVSITILALLPCSCSQKHDAAYDQSAASMAAPDFSKYPKTQAFRHYLHSNTNAARHRQHSDLLAISAFPSGDSFALQYSVTESGYESDYQFIYSWSARGVKSKQLSETNLTALKTAINQLPVNCASPPTERLVLVSFLDGTNWITRSYDGAALPAPMIQIYEIVGERPESRKDK